MIKFHSERHFRRTPVAALCRSMLALQVAGATGLALAQTGNAPATELPGVLVTASRLPSTPSGLAQNVTVIDQPQLQEANAARIEDILNRLTGVYVDQAGRTGGFSSLYMRGAENSHLMIMVDGVKVNDPTTTRGSAYDLSAIDIGQIERIELLRGPASAIHGGEALAGVLNIITKKPVGAGLQGSGYAGLGQDHYQRVGGSVGWGDQTLRAQVGIGHSRDGNGGSDASLRQNTFSGSLRFTPGGGIEGEAFARRNERKSEAFPDDSGGPRLAVIRQKTIRDATDWLYGVQGNYALSSTLRLQAGVSIYDRKEHSDNPAIDPGVRDPIPAFVGDSDFRRTTLNATATQQIGPFASLVFGFEHQREHGGQNSVFDFGAPVPLPFDLKRNTNSVFAEARMQLAPSVALQAGLRYDKVAGLSSETTPHLGAVWNLANGATILKASYGEGFKPPSFFALGFPIGANPNLRPERSRSLEFTATHRIDGEGTGVHVSVFETRYQDLVDFVQDPTNPPFFFRNVNRGLVVVNGIEPMLKWQVLDRVRTQLSLTLLDIDERDGLAPLRNRPEKRGTATVAYDIDNRSSMQGVVGYTGSFLDRSNPTGDIRLGGYTVLDASYSIRFGALTAKVALDNVLDRHYEQFVGFPGQERRLRVEVRGSF